MSVWSDSVIQEDIEFIRGSCPDLDDTYETCFVEFVTDRYRGGKRPTVRCPPLHEFVRRFLECVGQHENLITGEYFHTKDTILKRITCMDSCRATLFALVTAESVRVELESVAGTQVSAASSRPLARASQADIARLEQDVTPQDSVSQVGRETSEVEERLLKRAQKAQPPAPMRDVTEEMPEGVDEEEDDIPSPPRSVVSRVKEHSVASHHPSTVDKRRGRRRSGRCEQRRSGEVRGSDVGARCEAATFGASAGSDVRASARQRAERGARRRRRSGCRERGVRSGCEAAEAKRTATNERAPCRDIISVRPTMGHGGKLLPYIHAKLLRLAIPVYPSP